MRESGSELTLKGAVSGTALLTGEIVQIDGPITGDVALTAGSVSFGSDGRIDGVLTVYQPEGETLEVPAGKASEIHRETIKGWEGDFRDFNPVNPRNWFWGFLKGILFITVAAAVIAAMAPGWLAEMRRTILAEPMRMLGLGFLGQSALIGGAILIALTLVGLLITPVALLAGFIAGTLGYVIASYAIGVWVVMALGRSEPDSLGDRAIAAVVGALLVGVVSLLPFLGWLFFLVVTLTGSGVLVERLLRPRFRTAA